MQAKLIGSQPAKVQKTSRVPTPPPEFAGALSEQPQSPALGSSVRHTPETTLASGKAPFSEAAQAQPKDYGAPWAVAAAESDIATASLAADMPTPGKPSRPAGLPVQDAASHQDEAHQRKEFAPSVVTALPKQHLSLTDSFANQHPSTPGFLSVPFSTPSAAAPPVSPALKFGLPPVSRKAIESEPPVHQTDTSHQQQQQQQQEATVSTPAEQSAVPVLANGPSTKAGSKVQQGASTSSDGSGDTSVNLYPFPTERSAQDRLEGIASSAPYAQDVQGLYVFGRKAGPMPEHEKPRATSTAANLPLSHENGHHLGSPSGPHQVQPQKHAVVIHCAICILQGSAHISFSCSLVMRVTCLNAPAVHTAEHSSLVHQLCLSIPSSAAQTMASWSAQCPAEQTGQDDLLCLSSTLLTSFAPACC